MFYLLWLSLMFIVTLGLRLECGLEGHDEPFRVFFFPSPFSSFWVYIFMISFKLEFKELLRVTRMSVNVGFFIDVIYSIIDFFVGTKFEFNLDLHSGTGI